jgi:hypothetical protein
MAATASRTTSPERVASSRAPEAAAEASLAPSALRRTVAVISSRAAAVSSRLAACCSVRATGRPRRRRSRPNRAQAVGGADDLAHGVAQAVDGGVEVFLDRQEAAFEGLGDPGGQVAAARRFR